LIASVRGKLAEKREDAVVVELGGLGLQLSVSSRTLQALPSCGAQVTLLAHLYVREDQLQLYGFAEPGEKELFQQLIGVTGVGPRLALAILSAYSPEQLTRIVASEDLDSLQAISGVGKKSAQRLLVELRDRLGPFPETLAGAGVAVGADLVRDAREALRNLGYSAAEAAKALEGFTCEGEPQVEDLIRYALSRVAGK
jgi:Holliday junction DNA helicase RuvA